MTVLHTSAVISGLTFLYPDTVEFDDDVDWTRNTNRKDEKREV